MRPGANAFPGVVQKQGESDGRIGGQNSWVIDLLGPNDVLVIDLFGKIKYIKETDDRMTDSRFLPFKPGDCAPIASDHTSVDAVRR
jgi:hypothetical protein